MKILVTGGAGFIGSALCERLLKNGDSVICVDNLSSGRRVNISHLESDDRMTFLKRDITEPLGIDGKIDRIYHLASMASPIDFETHALEIALTGSLGTINVLQIAREKKARFLLSSTSEVYGQPTRHPQSEDYWGNVNPVGVRACYDESKRFSEMMTTVFGRTHDLDVRIARIFNTYGPGMRPGDGRVIPNFVTQALSNRPMTINGDGQQTRCFCYIDDMVDGLIKLMETDDIRNAGPVNLGSDKEITVLQLANMIRDMTSSDSRLVFNDMPSDDPVRRRPDIRKAAQILGWKPKTTLGAGLKKVIEKYHAVKTADQNMR
ncbi:MAG: SDR family oxidoreductase [Candidatus Thermoplasmatota archaeon]|nr:SDR family oxidoreductase [Candidatus Thermoplasmatota archaeon]